MSLRGAGRRAGPLAWAALVLAAAVLVRAGVYGRVHARLGPDGFSYLNLARQLRGVPVPPGWDELANLPRDNQAARTPGYPLVLDLTFLLDGHRPTPAPLLAAFEKQRRSDPWHFDFLARSENIRAVQFLQHGLGAAAALLVFATVLHWTGRGWLAASTAGLAVGLRPAWAYLYEPTVQTEVLAATLMLLLVWLTSGIEGRREIGAGRAMLIAGVSAAGVLVRPALVVSAPLALGGLGRVGGCRGRVLTAATALWLGLVGGWVVRNGLVHGYWGLSSVVPQNLASHVPYDGEAFTDPVVRSLCARTCGQPYAGAWILRSMVRDEGFSYLDASARLGEQSLRAILRHPGRYLAGVGTAFGRFWYPPEIAISWEGAGSRAVPRLPGWLRSPGVAAYVLVTGSGLLLVSLVRAPRVARWAAATVVVSAAGTALVVGEALDDVRGAFPFSPIPVMIVALLVGQGLDRLAASARHHAAR